MSTNDGLYNTSSDDDSDNERQLPTKGTPKLSQQKDRDRQKESTALVVSPPRIIPRRELVINREREKQENAYLIGKKEKLMMVMKTK